MAAPPEPQALESVDWQAVGGRRRLSRRSTSFLVGIGIVGALWAYDHFFADVYLVFDWQVGPLEWLFLLSLVVFATQVLVPITEHPHHARRVWRRFRRRPEAMVALAVLLVVFVGGILGPVLRPVASNPLYGHQPPLFASVPVTSVPECAGPVVEGRCHGSARFPLGTDRIGRGILAFTLSGARTALYIGFIGGLLVVPVATLVGLLAGYRGGLVDSVLMAGVDVQQTLPAAVVYLVLVSVLSRSIWLLVVAFGVFSWGTVARLVRSEARQRAATSYVEAARMMGAGDLHVARRHLLPNVSNTVVTAMAHLVPLLVLTEAGIAYLGFGDIDADSWGRLIWYGLQADFSPIWVQWWVAPPGVVALALFVVSSKLVGDALRDALDPRDGNR